ncbi:MAG: arsenic-transporting ATPase [Chloroflexi bacterium RBG_16_48_7]|nr:MAG: arsenic-transporting ATPase [Chloroflexi bacterium RBG_16_48_7]
MLKDYVLPSKQDTTRFLFFSGKGGVGKSTMSCATAVWLAGKGYKTLLVTTDPAPNLSDIFGQTIGHKITPIDKIPNLWAIEINPDIASEEYRERAIAPVRDILDEKQLHVIMEQMKSPCVEEVAAFDKFIEFMDDPQYDVVIFDTAPTGHTIRLLELPSGWTTEISKGGSTCIGPSSSLQGSKLKYEKAISYLQNRGKTSFIFVLKAENLSILETRRSRQELGALGIKINLLIINGLYPAEACTDAFFKKKLAEQEHHQAVIEDEFNDIEKVRFPLMSSELNGFRLLEAAGRYLYEDTTQTFPFEDASQQKPTGMSLRYDREKIDSLLAPASGEKTRYVFITGKGGVGKSTVACLTALHMAEKGFKTLVLTTDPASHLEAIFGQEVGHEPSAIRGEPNLYAARIDQKKALEEYRQRILEAVKDLGDEVKTSVEEDLNSPCAEEMAAFERFMAYLVPGPYQIVVFDTAPTGHTLRLLELPSDWHGYIDLGSLTKKTSDGTIQEYDTVIAAMRDQRKSTFAFVMYPEFTPIIEAWRASEDLKAQVGIKTNLVVVNMLIPQDCGNNAFFDNRRKQQDKYLPLLQEKFPVPLLRIPLFDHEPEGLKDLRALSIKVFDTHGGIDKA